MMDAIDKMGCAMAPWASCGRAWTVSQGHYRRQAMSWPSPRVVSEASGLLMPRPGLTGCRQAKKNQRSTLVEGREP